MSLIPLTPFLKSFFDFRKGVRALDFHPTFAVY